MIYRSHIYYFILCLMLYTGILLAYNRSYKCKLFLELLIFIHIRIFIIWSWSLLSYWFIFFWRFTRFFRPTIYYFFIVFIGYKCIFWISEIYFFRFQLTKSVLFVMYKQSKLYILLLTWLSFCHPFLSCD